MKQTIQHEKYGEILYEESALSGKKTISMGGVPLEKISKKEFKMQDGTTATVNGNVLTGATLNVNGETITLSSKVKWYEIVLCIFPLLLTLIWGNSTALCEIVPVVGGAIGGAIGGMFSVLGLYGIRLVKPIWLKILIALAALGVTFGICAGIGYAIISALS